LLLKWAAGLVFSVVLVAVLGIFGLCFASFWFPWGGMFVGPPLTFATFDAAEGLQRYLLVHLFMIPKAVTLMTLGFMFSCFNMKPAAATILALSLLLISGILEQVPFFSEFQQWFISYHVNVWQSLFDARIPWWRVGQSMCMLAGYNATFLVLGCTAFHVRDIKS
jgi:ABC-2 type transport system permease protein